MAAALDGPVLLLSVATMGGSGPVDDPAACCRACQTTDGCAGWSHCARDGGCGDRGGCSGYVAKQPARGGGGGVTRYPVTWLGPQDPRLGSCTGDGRWPKGTCTLRGAAPGSGGGAKAAVAVAAQGAAAEGWVSALAPKPSPASPGTPSCPPGLTDASCATCAASRAPSDCLSCLGRPRAYGPSAAAAEACAGCAALPDARLRAACVDCVSENGPEGGCASCLIRAGFNGASADDSRGSGGSSFDEEASAQCFRCVAGGGRAVGGGRACFECFVSRSGGPVDAPACLACVADVSLGAAARAGCGGCHDRLVQDRRGCMKCLAAKGVDSDEKAAACGGCSHPGLSSVTEGCYGCLKTVGQGAAYMCSKLGQQPGRPVPSDALGLAPKYYQCLAATAREPSGPSDCYACLQIPRFAYADRCLGCRTRSLGRDAASWCAGCWFPSKAPEAAAGCESCLGRKDTSYANGFSRCVFPAGGPARARPMQQP